MGDMNADRSVDDCHPVSALQLWADQARRAVKVMGEVVKEVSSDG